jgi:hypothetical protein
MYHLKDLALNEFKTTTTTTIKNLVFFEGLAQSKHKVS